MGITLTDLPCNSFGKLCPRACSYLYVCVVDERVNQVNEAIEPDTPIEQLRQEPYSLPGGFNWDTLNLDDPLIVSQSLIAAVFTWDGAAWLIVR